MSAAEREATVLAIEASAARLKRAIEAIAEPLIRLDVTLAKVQIDLEAIIAQIEREAARSSIS